MKHTIYTPSVMDNATEDVLWEKGIIVFDTCALLDFYYMTPDYQEIMSEILSHLSDRIWLPSQVVYEYKKNRENTMLKPISENYRDNDIQNNHFVDILKAYIAQWEKQYYHPYISDTKLQDVKNSLSVIEPEIAKIKTIVAFEYQTRKQEIRDIQKNDVIAAAINALQHGEPFSFSQIKEIVKEGTIRYANQIGPGYKGAETKTGVRQYGDLIIWKEILKYAKDQKRDIIFVTNDTKADWVIVNDSKKDPKAETPSLDEIGHPRRELLAEFEEETEQTVWFYKSADFIKKLEEFYQPNQAQIAFYGKLGVVRDVLERIERERDIRQHHSDDSLLIRCGECGELFDVDADDLCFDWEGGVVDDERGMGPESEYESQESCICPNCGKQIDITLQVWEYPMGCFNTQIIEIDGGEIEEPIDLSKYISFEDYEDCWKCGERAILNEHHLCEQCEEEFNRFVNSDD